MIIKLTADRRVILDDRDNFRAFKLVVEAQRADLSDVRRALAGTAEMQTPHGFRRTHCDVGPA